MATAVAEKLQLFKSPLVDSSDDETLDESPPEPAVFQREPDISHLGNRTGAYKDAPAFKRYEDANTLELFFDLFFAANYCVFSSTNGVTSSERLQSYVGYFSVLWITWLLVGLYDVRFLTDSIFERCTRGVQLGVMVGFAVVAPHFNPSEQNAQTMRTMSLILMISRFTLAVEYGSILWHIRRFKAARLPLYLQIGLNIVAGLIYMGITFRFDGKGDSRAFLVWYIIGALEVLITFLMSNFWEVLSLTETHLMKRMSLLTVVVLGDAIVIVAQNVVTIVESPDAWSPTIIGIVTAATATIYFVFLTYFDWMKRSHLPAWRQQVWTLMHFPFHLSMVMFMQGMTQFIIWTKIIDVINHISFDSILNNADETAEATSAIIQENLQDVVYSFITIYPITYADTWTTVDQALANVTDIPDDFWPQLALYSQTGIAEDQPPPEYLQKILDIIEALFAAMINSMFEKFKIDIHKELVDGNTDPNADTTSGAFQVGITNKTWDRYALVFAYGYVCAGITLLLMTLLTIVSRVNPWRPWPLIRTVINILLAFGLSFVALIYYSPTRQENYLYSPWLIPTICIVWLIVLFMTHTHNAPPLFFPKGAERTLKSRKSWLARKKSDDAVELTNGNTPAKDGAPWGAAPSQEPHY